MSKETEIADLEMQIFELNRQLEALRKDNPGTHVPNYTFRTLSGEVTLRDLFGDHDTLLVIHNMGQGCRYCTLWADGFNGFVPHLESALSVVLVSKDPPEVQRSFANSRGWRFRLASHGGGDYIREQTAQEGVDNMPGAVVYKRDGRPVEDALPPMPASQRKHTQRQNRHRADYHYGGRQQFDCRNPVSGIESGKSFQGCLPPKALKERYTCRPALT